MKKYFLIILVFMSLGINEVQAQETADYKVSVFHDFGWYYCTLVNNSNITILCYANKNEYHKSGKPLYILQGTIGIPDKRNISLGEGDPKAGVVKFKVIYSDPTKKGFIPSPGSSIWYKVNKGGKDQLEMEAGEGTLDIQIAK
jgi:hypothetical protein